MQLGKQMLVVSLYFKQHKQQSRGGAARADGGDRRRRRPRRLSSCDEKGRRVSQQPPYSILPRKVYGAVCRDGRLGPGELTTYSNAYVNSANSAPVRGNR